MGRGRSKSGGGGGGGSSDEEKSGGGAFDPATATLDDFYKQDYKRFTDEAEDNNYSWEYIGTGREQSQFFRENSNFDEVAKNITDSERDSLENWFAGRLMRGQQYGDFNDMTRREQRWTRDLDAVIDESTLDKGVVVVRRASGELLMGKGHRGLTLEEAQSMKGNLVFSKGALSTGAASQGLTIGDSSKPVEYRIHIVGGSKGACLWGGEKSINPGWGRKQREVIMNRESYYMVGDSTYDSSRGIIVTDVFWAGRSEHDYGFGKK